MRLISLAERHRIPEVWRLVLVAIITLSLSAAQDSPKATTSQTKQEEPTLDAVLALKDPLLLGEVPTYYTPGFKERAEGIRDFLAGERAFYKEKLGITVPLTIAVLDAKQWQALNILDPYAIPTVTDVPPYVALMPANWAENQLGMLPDESKANPSVVQQVRAASVGWNDTFYRGFDTIIGHEFGHAAASVTGIDKPKHWLDEFLATYFLIAYVHERRADPQFPMKIFFSINLEYPHPYTSLDNFESRYPLSNTLPTNYGWYQSQFWRRGEEVYRLQGVNFLRKMKVEFPAGHNSFTLSNAEVLRKLDHICPGFVKWADTLE